MQQLFLNFPIKEEFLAEDFFVSSANEAAFQQIMRWPSWGEAIYSKILLLCGDKGSGKTHLAHLWKNKAEAEFVSLGSYYKSTAKTFVFENIDEIKNEEELFHLINFVIENKIFMLLTSKFLPSKLNFSLPDLKSRIMAIPYVVIEAPDQDLLRTVLIKNLYERHLRIHPATIDYILSRIDRSFANLFDFVCAIERYSKTNKRPITIQAVKLILEKVQL